MCFLVLVDCRRRLWSKRPEDRYIWSNAGDDATLIRSFEPGVIYLLANQCGSGPAPITAPMRFFNFDLNSSISVQVM